jgi:hypothetical protein
MSGSTSYKILGAAGGIELLIIILFY